MKKIIITLIIGILLGFGATKIMSDEPSAGTCVDSMTNSIKSGFNDLVNKVSN